MSVRKVCIVGASGKLGQYRVQQYASGTAQAVLDHADRGARLIFSCGWHISKDGQDVYTSRLKMFVKVFGWLARVLRLVELDDQNDELIHEAPAIVGCQTPSALGWADSPPGSS